MSCFEAIFLFWKTTVSSHSTYIFQTPSWKLFYNFFLVTRKLNFIQITKIQLITLTDQTAAFSDSQFNIASEYCTNVTGCDKKNDRRKLAVKGHQIYCNAYCSINSVLYYREHTIQSNLSLHSDKIIDLHLIMVFETSLWQSPGMSSSICSWNISSKKPFDSVSILPPLMHRCL